MHLLRNCRINSFWSNYDPQVPGYRESVSTPLIKAVRQASRDVISLLLENGADTELVNEDSKTPMFYAANITATHELLRHGASVNHQDHFDQTPLFRATNVAESKALLRHGVNVNHRDQFGQTALFYAICRSRRDLVEFLISYGADVNIYTRAGKGLDFWAEYKECSFTPLQQAMRSFIEMSKLKPSTAEYREAPI